MEKEIKTIKQVKAHHLGYLEVTTNNGVEHCPSDFDTIQNEINKKGGGYVIRYIGEKLCGVFSEQQIVELYGNFKEGDEFVYDPFEDEYYSKTMILMKPIDIEFFVLKDKRD